MDLEWLSVNMKKVFYLYKSGELQRKDFSLLLQEKNGNVVYIPVEQINLIVCFGDVNLNKRVLGLLNSYSVSILFFNSSKTKWNNM